MAAASEEEIATPDGRIAAGTLNETVLRGRWGKEAPARGA
jgi:hypothetical protein